ncbi:MAG: hydantoinase/oxoprolinase family protein [Desulfovibrionaceae bacterium]|nr:hydantoinase/oxoprolinase family protein [Desulfovibrionaceae bacterium]MBF0514949.1 hydantoinase/oxoprolinase family protein [Desulfovibrionaceae bacterium]
MLLGIDVGGTHTDAVLLDLGGIVATRKVKTDHADLLGSIAAVLEGVLASVDPAKVLRLNLSTTLSTNAIVEGKSEPVGVFVSCGPGIDPEYYRVGGHYFLIGGAVDHRGTALEDVNEAALCAAVEKCRADGVRVFASVGKFSTRNPEHEEAILEKVHPLADFVTSGRRVSGQLGFHRRINTAYFNSSVWRLFNRFADAVQRCVASHGLRCQVNILKADGGAMPLSVSRRAPVESILSGPAASVMGIIAICDIDLDSVILDIGGTTTDIAVFADGAPLIAQTGISISGKPTLVRAFKTRSIGIGGDSAIAVEGGLVTAGPQRYGPSMADGGEVPTLIDAFNVQNIIAYGDTMASYSGISELAMESGLDPETLADYAIGYAANRIREETALLIREINEKPVYTIFELLEGKFVRPAKVYVMGGPARAFATVLREAFSLPVLVPENHAVANAAGAALARATVDVELFADTQKGRMFIPGLGVERAVPPSYSLDQARAEAVDNLRDYLGAIETEDPDLPVDILEESVFNMIEDSRLAGRSIRVKCQVKPGVAEAYKRGIKRQC